MGSLPPQSSAPRWWCGGGGGAGWSGGLPSSVSLAQAEAFWPFVASLRSKCEWMLSTTQIGVYETRIHASFPSSGLSCGVWD